MGMKLPLPLPKEDWPPVMPQTHPLGERWRKRKVRKAARAQEHQKKKQFGECQRPKIRRP